MSLENILYIEDEEDYQMLVQRILGKEGFQVRVAATAEDGLRGLAENKPDLLILDVNLPDGDGYAICSELRKNPEWATLPVLMLTVRRRPEEWLRGFSAGANDYVSKPLNPPELVERVASCLTGRPLGEQPSDETGAEYLLIQAAVSGNRTAFEVLIRKYKQRLLDSLRASGKSTADAEDAASLAFTKAFAQLQQFRGQSSFYTWLYRIAFNEKQNRRRVEGVSIEELTQEEHRILPPALSEPDTLAHDLAESDMQEKIQLAVSNVPKRYRKMLNWYFVHNLSYHDMSRRMNVPQGTVMSRLFKAKQLLRKSWSRSSPIKD